MWPFKYPYTNFHEMNLDWLLGTVKSNTERITENELKIKLIGGDDPLNSLHPVGSIFISAENTSPASLFGGEWTQINGRFLIGTGAPELNDDGTSPGSYNFAADSKRGEAAHTLMTEEMPSHSHKGVFITGISMVWKGSYNTGTTYGVDTGEQGDDSTFYTGQTGGGGAHNNMPPYLAVYMWKRVG